MCSKVVSVFKPSLLGLALALLGSACAQGAEPVPPFERSFDSARTLRQDFVVRKAGLYAVSLGYAFDPSAPAARGVAWNFAGGIDQGAPLHVEIQLGTQARADAPVLQRTVDRPKLSSWGSGVLYSELASVHLEPGRYRLRVTLTGSAAPSGVILHSGVSSAYRGK
jgi:hypothetical protein